MESDEIRDEQSAEQDSVDAALSAPHRPASYAQAVRRIVQMWHGLAPVDQFGVTVAVGFASILALLVMGLYLNGD